MSGELVQSWRQQILQCHEASQRADGELKKAILGKIEAVRVTGALISECRDSLNERQFKEATEFLSLEAVRAYIRFSKANKAEVTDLHAGLHSIKIALQTSGALEFSGHGPQTLHHPNFYSTAIHYVQKLVADFRKFCRRHPLRDWDRHELDAFLASVKPIVDVYREANLELKSRS